jgi:sulfite reductase beta subunit-like hemoprotein
VVAAYQFHFDTHLDRKNRNRARIKFLVEKLGIEGFRKLWQKEYDRLKALPDRRIRSLESPPENPKPLDAPPADGKGFPPTENYRRWRKTNVVPQKQKGYVAVTVRTILGDLTPKQTRALAAIIRRYGVYSRTTILQNVLLRWVREKDVESLYRDLFAAGLALAGADQVQDVTVCPGADTCNLAITSSKGVGRVVTEMLASPEFDDLGPLSVKISGCFNGCGQHTIANIGLYCASRNIDGREVPHYMLHLGGDAGHGPAEYGKVVIRLPAKRVPEAIRGLLELYRRKRQSGETFNQFVKRYDMEGMKGTGNPHGTMKQFLEQFESVPKFAENADFYTDYGALASFSTADIGAGECAGVDSSAPVAPAAKRPEKVNNPNYPGGS